MDIPTAPLVFLGDTRYNLTMRVTYEELGCPLDAGWYDLEGIGMVRIREEDINLAKRLHGKVGWFLVELEEEEVGDPDMGPVKTFELGEAFPLGHKEEDV